MTPGPKGGRPTPEHIESATSSGMLASSRRMLAVEAVRSSSTSNCPQSRLASGPCSSGGTNPTIGATASAAAARTSSSLVHGWIQCKHEAEKRECSLSARPEVKTGQSVENWAATVSCRTATIYLRPRKPPWRISHRGLATS